MSITAKVNRCILYHQGTAYQDATEFDWSLGYAAPAPEMQENSDNASSSTGAPPGMPQDVQNAEPIAEMDAEDGYAGAPNFAEIRRLKDEAVYTLTEEPTLRFVSPGEC